MLRKYILDTSHILEAPLVKFKEDLSFEVQPVEIVDQKIKELRNKVFRWSKYYGEVIELRDDLGEQSIHEKLLPVSILQLVSTNFEDKISLNGYNCST